jgi:hypothetical protein
MDFANWLGGTGLCHFIQDNYAIIRLGQTAHIVLVGMVLISLLSINLRLMGVAGHRQTLPEITKRFLPWTWWGIVGLLATGTLQIIGEPARELASQVFWLKMGLLAGLIVITLIYQGFLKSGAYDRSQGAAKLIGFVSLVLLVLLITAGRWIAYAPHL